MVNLWTPTVLKIYRALDGQMRLVGGCVRDFLMSREPEDIDMATPLLPQDIYQKLLEKGIKSHPISPRHGLVGIVLPDNSFEITTLRQDTYNRGKQEVTFITDYATDAVRRDFTINALSMDRERIYDYFGGAEDIKTKTIRFIGDPKTRILEDPLRMLRYIRFWAGFGGDKTDTDILHLFSVCRDRLVEVSSTRLKKEFSKIIMGQRALSALILMREVGLLSHIVCRDGVEDMKKLLASNPQASLRERLLCFNNYI